VSGCRDCDVCTQSFIEAFAWFWLRLMWRLTFGWNIGLFFKRCPQCGHYLRWHKMHNGYFMD